LAAFLTASLAMGAVHTYTDIDRPTSSGRVLLGSGDSVSGTLNVLAGAPTDSASQDGFFDSVGYNPATQDLATAKFYAWMGDDESALANLLEFLFINDEWYEARVNGQLVGSGEVDNNTVLEVSFGSGTATFDLIDATGQLPWRVKSTDGDFWLDYVALRITAEDTGTPPDGNPAPPDGAVPEPASLVLWSLFAPARRDCPVVVFPENDSEPPRRSVRQGP
jgi:hypothetical protein